MVREEWVGQVKGPAKLGPITGSVGVGVRREGGRGRVTSN